MSLEYLNVSHSIYTTSDDYFTGEDLPVAR